MFDVCKYVIVLFIEFTYILSFIAAYLENVKIVKLL